MQGTQQGTRGGAAGAAERGAERLTGKGTHAGQTEAGYQQGQYQGSYSTGAYTVTVVRGTGLKDTDWVGDQDPYVRFEVGDQRVETPVARDGGPGGIGTEPVWNETVSIRTPRGAGATANTLRVTVLNMKRLLPDRIIGYATVDLTKLEGEGEQTMTLPLVGKKGGDAGSISVRIRPGAMAPSGGARMADKTGFAAGTTAGTAGGAVPSGLAGQTYTTVEDRPVVHEVTETILTHHPVERQYVTEVREAGQRELPGESEVIDVKEGTPREATGAMGGTAGTTGTTGRTGRSGETY